jgi:hypothetical protein
MTRPLSPADEDRMLEAMFSLAPKFVRLPFSNPAPASPPSSVTAAVVVAGEPAAAAAFSSCDVISINAIKSRILAAKAKASKSASFSE